MLSIVNVPLIRHLSFDSNVMMIPFVMILKPLCLNWRMIVKLEDDIVVWYEVSFFIDFFCGSFSLFSFLTTQQSLSIRNQSIAKDE